MPQKPYEILDEDEADDRHLGCQPHCWAASFDHREALHPLVNSRQPEQDVNAQGSR